MSGRIVALTGEKGGIEVGFSYVGGKVWENVRVWSNDYRIKIVGRVLA